LLNLPHAGVNKSNAFKQQRFFVRLAGEPVRSVHDLNLDLVLLGCSACGQWVLVGGGRKKGGLGSGLCLEKIFKPLACLVGTRLELTILFFRGQQGFSKVLVLSSKPLQGR
jgi:hypothetical protein